MHIQDLLSKYPRPTSTNRTAEIAALILSRSVTVKTAFEPGGMMGDPSTLKSVKAETMAPAHAAYVAELLVSRAEGLHRLAEVECNTGLSEPQEKRQDKLRAEVVEIAEAVGFFAETSGDPRGAVVKLRDPFDGTAGDGFGGGYWAVYR